jgi:hypothetical protein
MTDEMPLLLAPTDKFVTLNIFDGKFSVDFPTREDWSTECVDMVAPDGLIFFSDGCLCGGRAGASVFSDMQQSFNPKYMLFWRVQSIAISIYSDSWAALLAFKSSRAVLQCGDSL